MKSEKELPNKMTCNADRGQLFPKGLFFPLEESEAQRRALHGVLHYPGGRSCCPCVVTSLLVQSLLSPWCRGASVSPPSSRVLSVAPCFRIVVSCSPCAGAKTGTTYVAILVTSIQMCDIYPYIFDV